MKSDRLLHNKSSLLPFVIKFDYCNIPENRNKKNFDDVDHAGKYGEDINF